MEEKELFHQLLGKHLKWKRIEQGFTQEGIAEKTDLSDKYVGRIEQGLQSPSFVIMVKLSEALNFRIDPLIALIKLEMKEYKSHE
ncbi:Helix-turn-helix [Virgibacillus subterraneus]|uniref:Helix-turn-helix n=1 Tax=Virgibacillus subterraneus TaxID=621109 RepID=A0A1H9GAU8_9BACI|nr:helix-turn-helix transcriptional regulator [Virgibacillus subterraneus]SEQ47227.1 Helix-turn-helix [Virgibacillus subterraneus]